MYEVELQRINDETVVIFPQALVERTSRAEGDVLYLFERDGEFILSANDPESGEATQAAE